VLIPAGHQVRHRSTAGEYRVGQHEIIAWS
jgi:hypothetical protein